MEATLTKSPALEKLLLEDVFVTEGLPEFTFVKPPNYNEILMDIRRAGKPLVIEGQSGTGKTTCVRQILSELSDDIQTEYLTARETDGASKIERIAIDRPTGCFVIDDFHRLDLELQKSLADIAKLAAELGPDSAMPKLVIIGINQVGSDLIQLVPDIAKRMGVHRIKPGRSEDISALIERGCDRLNVFVEDPSTICDEARGDYWLAQQLCQSICSAAGILETSEEQTKLKFDISDIRGRVVDRLKSTYHPAVKEFCRGRRFRASNDPYFKLLRVIVQQGNSVVDINELANSTPELRLSINNIKEHRLAVLIESKTNIAQHFYYNRETKNFAIEDPALFYYIQHLDWTQLRKDCGFRENSESFEFEVAISFAGEQRRLAKFIAEALQDLDVSVFYDEMFEANFLGKAWRNEFRRIFGRDSRFVLCLLDKNHDRKIWPTFEREIFAPKVDDERLIPIYLDDTVFVGIPQDIVGIHFRCEEHYENWESEATDRIILPLIDRLD